MRTDLGREELLALVRRIRSSELGGDALDDAVELFLLNCRDPAGSDLIFWPDLAGFARGIEPTDEEIVERAVHGAPKTEHP